MRKIIYRFTLLYIIMRIILEYILNTNWKIFVFDIIHCFSDVLPMVAVKLCGSLIFLLMLCDFLLYTVKFVNIKITIRVKRKIKFIMNSRILMKKGKYITLFLFIVICLNDFLSYTENDNLGSWKETSFIAHAGGEIEGYTYSNCGRAIRENYKKGYRVFEIDLALTSDNKIVAKHDWDSFIIQDGVEPGHIPTKDEFLSKPLWGIFEPLSLEELCSIMVEYEDIWIITDTKYEEEEFNRIFFNEFIDMVNEEQKGQVLDRFIVQVYDDKMKDFIEEIYPFKSWIFTLYKQEIKNKEDKVLEFIRYSYLEGIDAITVQKEKVTQSMVETAQKYGIKIFVHTVNDKKEAEGMFRMGIDSIYTDRLYY